MRETWIRLKGGNEVCELVKIANLLENMGERRGSKITCRRVGFGKENC